MPKTTKKSSKESPKDKGGRPPGITKVDANEIVRYFAPKFKKEVNKMLKGNEKDRDKALSLLVGLLGRTVDPKDTGTDHILKIK